MARPRSFGLLSIATLLLVMLSDVLPSDGMRMKGSPIRRVITMLQMMEKKSKDQADMEEKLFDKFMCNCKKATSKLQAAISLSQERIPQLESSIEETLALKGQLTQEIQQAKDDRATATKSLSEAKSMRQTEAQTFAKESTENKANIEAMKRAIAALSKGLPQEEFLQTASASFLQGLVLTGRPGKGYDREALSAFLQQGDQTEDSSEILGILKQMQADMETELADSEKGEAAAIASFEALEDSKTKQITAAVSAIEEKGSRLAAAKVQLVEMKADLKDTKQRLESDQESFAKQNAGCKKRDGEYAELKKQLADEQQALADTIKILADDQAMDLFKKTVATGASSSSAAGAAATFLQVGSSSRSRQQQALRVVQQLSEQSADSSAGASPALQLIARSAASEAAAKGRGGGQKGFEKIIGLIDKMVQLLATEAEDDATKKTMCKTGLEKNADTKAELENKLKSITAELGSMKNELGIIATDMAKITQDLADLDGAVKDATDQRKKENAAYKQVLSDTNAAVDILEVAKNRLKEFYPAALLQQQRLPARAAKTPGHGSESEFGALLQENSESEREASDTQTVSKARKAGQLVVKYITTIQQELKAEFQTAKKDEGDAQADYEDLLKDSQGKREVFAKAMTEKEGAKAALQETMKKRKDKSAYVQKELDETIEVIADLHKECDWLLKNFDERNKLRSAEADALQKAKATLAGADYGSPP